ncbi:MAG: hypothetical protein M9955_19720 [Rhizobiaceae bacterium]|nr:hypothetical protein [Rhizobiaceae bacterium]
MASFMDVLNEIDSQALNYFPPAPSMPNNTMGGLGGLGGFRGWLQQPGVSNALQAIGSSLLTSPRNNPLQNMPQFLDAYNSRYQKQQEGLRDRNAIKRVLMQYGASEQEAEQLSYNSNAAELWLKQRTNQKSLEADKAFNDSLAGIGQGGTGTSDDPFTGSVDAPVSGALIDRRPLSSIATDPSAERRQVAQADDIALPGAGSGTLEQLYSRRDAYVNLARNTRNAEQLSKLKVFIDNIDAKIEREEERIKPTESLRELAAINQQREEQGLPRYRLDEWQQLKARSGATNIDMKGPSKYDETYNTEMAKRAIGIEDAATTARKQLGTLKLMEKAVADPGFYSGTGAGQVANLKRMATSLGLPGADGIDSTEAFNALSKQAALDAMGGSLGTGFSNADRSFVEEQVPNLANTKAGNQALIRIQRAMAERQLQIAEFARKYANLNEGRLDGQFYQGLAEWAEDNPLFGDGTGFFADDGRQNRAGGGSGRAGSATGPSRQRATNPNTGETVEWDGTQWRPVQ